MRVELHFRDEAGKHLIAIAGNGDRPRPPWATCLLPHWGDDPPVPRVGETVHLSAGEGDDSPFPEMVGVVRAVVYFSDHVRVRCG